MIINCAARIGNSMIILDYSDEVPNFVSQLFFTMNRIDIDSTTIRVLLDVFSYKDNGVQMMFAPALDLCGYGSTVEEAKQSFNVVVSEYLRYGLENNTLEDDLLFKLT